MEKAEFDQLYSLGKMGPRWSEFWHRAQAAEAWRVEFDLFVKRLQNEEECQVDRFEFKHQAVREVDELEERAEEV